MDIKIYQNSKETYFWTIDEVDEIIKICPEFIQEISNEPFDINFNWRGHNVIIGRNYHKLENFIKGVNVIVASHDMKYSINIDDIFSMVDMGDEYKFIIINKNIEDYWFSYDTRTDDTILKKISTKNNIRVIWDSCYGDYCNFYFNPKVHIQNYYNNSHFLGSLFLYGNQIYNDSKNKKRIGAHFNKLADNTRIKVSHELSKIIDDNLFFTINKECFHNKNKFTGNYQSNVFNTRLDNTGLLSDFYVDQFVNLTIKSEIEIIYETFTTHSKIISCVKWNEKTIKHLFLGKPFIHMDPYAHRLMKINGFTPYRPLFTDELWELYENSDINESIERNTNEYWVPLLIDNIKWLLSLDDDEWNKRLKDSLEIAKSNVNVVNNLIFNTSLFHYIELPFTKN